jgi:hypothetical protein
MNVTLESNIICPTGPMANNCYVTIAYDIPTSNFLPASCNVPFSTSDMFTMLKVHYKCFKKCNAQGLNQFYHTFEKHCTTEVGKNSSTLLNGYGITTTNNNSLIQEYLNGIISGNPPDLSIRNYIFSKNVEGSCERNNFR